MAQKPNNNDNVKSTNISEDYQKLNSDEENSDEASSQILPTDEPTIKNAQSDANILEKVSSVSDSTSAQRHKVSKDVIKLDPIEGDSNEDCSKNIPTNESTVEISQTSREDISSVFTHPKIMTKGAHKSSMTSGNNLKEDELCTSSSSSQNILVSYRNVATDTIDLSNYQSSSNIIAPATKADAESQIKSIRKISQGGNLPVVPDAPNVQDVNFPNSNDVANLTQGSEEHVVTTQSDVITPALGLLNIEENNDHYINHVTNMQSNHEQNVTTQASVTYADLTPCNCSYPKQTDIPMNNMHRGQNLLWPSLSKLEYVDYNGDSTFSRVSIAHIPSNNGHTDRIFLYILPKDSHPPPQPGDMPPQPGDMPPQAANMPPQAANMPPQAVNKQPPPFYMPPQFFIQHQAVNMPPRPGIVPHQPVNVPYQRVNVPHQSGHMPNQPDHM